MTFLFRMQPNATPAEQNRRIGEREREEIRGDIAMTLFNTPIVVSLMDFNAAARKIVYGAFLYHYTPYFFYFSTLSTVARQSGA